MGRVGLVEADDVKDEGDGGFVGEKAKGVKLRPSVAFSSCAATTLVASPPLAQTTLSDPPIEVFSSIKPDDVLHSPFSSSCLRSSILLSLVRSILAVFSLSLVAWRKREVLIVEWS